MNRNESKCGLFEGFVFFGCVLVGLACATKGGEAKPVVMNQPPEGFVALFNGEDLGGWKGLVGSPKTREKMTAKELAEAQAKADEAIWEHWKVADGVLCFDGEGQSLCTTKDYGDFELLVDWKIESRGDSGIYLRGSPQVQIWDSGERNVGSGGLYNNKKGPSEPLEFADKPVGQWNRFRIIMIGELVTVFLNDVLVVDNAVLENYWDRDKPIYPTGQIELQAHSSPLRFRNIFIREIPREAGAKNLSEQEKSEGFVLLFNGEDLTGWRGSTESHIVRDGKIVLDPELGGGSLYTVGEYDDFVFRFEFRLTPGANNGLAIRAPLSGTPAYTGIEIQILDNTSPKYMDLKPYQFHGSIYGVVPAERGHLKPIGEWNSEQVTAKGQHITVKLNDATIVDADLDEASTPKTMDEKDHPGLKREKGHIGFVGHGDYVEFRNIRIKVLN